MTVSPDIAAGRKALQTLANLREPFASWVLYLVHKDLDREANLRSQVFAIFLTAIIEAASERVNFEKTMWDACRKSGSVAGLKILSITSLILQAIEDLASIYKDDELIALQFTRNKLAHGRLRSSTTKDRHVWLSKGGVIASVKVSPKTYYDGTIQTVGQFGGTHMFLNAMRDKLNRHETLLWTMAQSVCLPGVIEGLSAELEGQTSGLVNINWGANIYAEAKVSFRQRTELFRSLASLRDEISRDPPLIDPLFA